MFAINTINRGIHKFKLIPARIRNITILGIETSCDDTAAAIVNDDRKIISQVINSQMLLHLRYGGIIPPVAGRLHRENIEQVVKQCLDESEIGIEGIDAIAVTNRPGLKLSLWVGVEFCKMLAKNRSKPIIPIHHMEAHALMPRLTEDIKFPYICLLISGGHCQLALVKSVDEFLLLGETIDDAPGEAFDKIARHMKLRNLPEFEAINGGAAIEIAAKRCEDIDKFDFPLPLSRYRDCNFSFAGLKNNAKRHIRKEEIEHKLAVDEVIPNYPDFCAGFLRAVSRHICHRTQRAIEFCKIKNMIPDNEINSLVVSGGVACNDIIFNDVSHIASSLGLRAFRPPKNLCNDNGVMIAWNGVERMSMENFSHLENIDDIEIIPKCNLGRSIVAEVTNEDIKCKWVKLPTFPYSRSNCRENENDFSDITVNSKIII